MIVRVIRPSRCMLYDLYYNLYIPRFIIGFYTSNGNVQSSASFIIDNHVSYENDKKTVKFRHLCNTTIYGGGAFWDLYASFCFIDMLFNASSIPSLYY